MSTEEETNPYELLQLESEATEQDIKTSYRKLSLKVHPDRNPNNPDAARLFHELNQAYELLLDPLRRLALDAKLRVKRARTERFKAYDTKRKNLVEELEERERAFKKAKLDKHKEEVKLQQETEKIKDEGRKLREQKEKELRMREQERLKVEKENQEDDLDPPELDPLDTTIRIKYSLKSFPNLTNREAIAQLLAQFGAVDVDSIVLSLKASKKSSGKTPRAGTALVPFKQIGDAFAAVYASGRADRGLDGVDIAWVSGKEPRVLSWLKKMGKLGTTPESEPAAVARPAEAGSAKSEQPRSRPAGDSAFSTFPSTFPDIAAPNTPVAGAGVDYESLTLMRLRQAERARLEREIRAQEAEEG